MKITKVYTRRGDAGTTDLVGGVRVRKSDMRIEAYGTIDELSSHLGLLVAMMGQHAERDMLLHIQNNLFIVGTHLATDPRETPLPESAHLPAGEVEQLEERIDDIVRRTTNPALGFILPGGTQLAAQCHVCRAVCRRAERRIVSLANVATVGDEIVQYVNRLSDYLFVLAKIINFNAGRREIVWENPCKSK